MKTSRRNFLGSGITAVAAAGALRGAKHSTASTFPDILRPPDLLTAYAEGGTSLQLKPSGARWQGQDVEVITEPQPDGAGRKLPIGVRSPQTALTRLHLRWSGTLPENIKFLGDQWERSYGDLAWRGFDGDRIMPWYFFASNGQLTHSYGVKTGSQAFCFWQADAAGISLWLDVRNGGGGVRLGERRLAAAEVVAEQSGPGDTPFQAAHKFCRRLCASPHLPHQPIYGSNNWYYLYGENMTTDGVLRDSELLAELAPPGTNRPYLVIDMGWGKAPDGAGPWTEENSRLGNLAQLAAQISKRGARPALWVRPLLTAEKLPEAWQLPGNHPGGPDDPTMRVIDPSVPAALEHLQEGLRRVTGWGFELIKHDFSTFDLLGRWGFQMGAELTAEGWHFADRSKTTAEIVLRFYRAIREAVGNAVLIGCNTMGHLGAGIFEVQRIGDDVSGRDWNRTRKMGVNALGFRLPQHRAFFLADPDCVPVSPAVPFEMTRQWCDLVTRSGAALFISADPATVTSKEKALLKNALAAGSRRQPEAEPLDWMATMSPHRWKFGGQAATFEWFGQEGANPFAK